MKNFTILSLFLFCLTSLFSREMGEFVKDVKIKPLEFQVPEIKSLQTDSGVEIYSLGNSEFPIVYADLYIYHGKKHLGKRPVEIGKLLEDSWELSGTKSYPNEKFLQDLEYYGATFSVSIDYEKTIISWSYLRNEESKVLPILKSFFLESSLDESIVATVRGKIAEEIKRRNDSPTGLGSRKAKEALFLGTILGTSMSLDSLSKITTNELLEFQSEILSEPKRRLLLTGDFDLSVWKDFFPKLIPKSNSRPEEVVESRLLSKNVENFKKEIRLVEKDVNQSFVSMFGVLPKHDHPDFYAIQILNYIIGAGGFNSYYMREIRNNRGLAYSAGSNTEFQENYGVLQFYAMTKTESVPEVLNLMKELIQTQLISNLKEDELIRAKNAIQNQFVFQFEDARRTLASEVRRKDHNMPVGYLLDFRKNIEAVSLDDLKRVGKTYFKSDSLIVTIVGPKSLESNLKGQVKIMNPED
ncbi:pitrilysin family protein [Leptospira sp. 96542]|nr:pitrilysin family protein [Leptospira sp. 96542]